MSNIYSPDKSQTIHRIEPTKEDRKKLIKDFKKQKADEKKIKDERFTTLLARKLNTGKYNKGINIEVTSDS